jgi:RNA polymerase sigma factor (sigma-70 family)
MRALEEPHRHEQNSGTAEGVIELTDHLFRREAGKLVSILTRIFGIDRLQMAEDVVQEALVRALRTWPYHGVPKNPSAWLMQTAKHLALDLLRREKLFFEKEPEIITFIEQRLPGTSLNDEPMLEDEIKDDRLRLMFACCHPILSQEAQTALALKVLCAFSPREIAKAFLTTEAAIVKRLTRARQRLQEQKVSFEIPSGGELPARLDSVLQILYLLFNEGYKASGGQNLVRKELCADAVRLGTMLAAHPAGDQPRTHALLALMLLNSARLSERIDNRGRILRLNEQDRSRWNRSLIQAGMLHLELSAKGDKVSEYHLQAGIAACHCMAPDYASTDWRQILSLYDALAELNDSPVIALNRAVAVAKVYGPQKGIEAVEAILNRQQLDSYHLFHAVLGELEAQRNQFHTAAKHLRKAIRLTDVTSERSFLEKKLEELEEQAS